MAIGAAALISSRQVGVLRREAEELGEASVRVAERATAIGDTAQYDRAVDNIRAKIEELEATADPGFWDAYWQSVSTFWGDPEWQEAQVQLDAYKGSVSDLVRESARLPLLAVEFGTSRDVMFEAARAAGLLGGELAALPYDEAIRQLAPFVSEIENLAEKTGQTAEEFVESGTSIESWADAFLTSADVVTAAALATGITVGELFSTEEEVIDKVAEALLSVIPLWQDMADEAGVATEAIADQALNTLRLLAAHEALEGTLQGVAAAQEAAASPAERLNQAQAALAETVARFRTGDASLEEVAKAYGVVNAALNATGISAEDATVAQQLLLDAFVNLAVEAGHTREEAVQLAAAWLLLTSAEGAQLRLEGRQALEEAQVRVDTLRESLHDPIVAIIAADRGISEQEFAAALAEAKSGR